jgi:putative inorganic carbon (hco3(-)) transporter
MTYILAVLYLSCLYVRPGEVLPGWYEFPFLEVLAWVSALSLAASLAVRPRRLWNLPHDRYTLGFVLAIVVSNAASGWLFGAYQALLGIAPALFCYVLLRSAVETPRQLQWIRYALVAITLLQATNAIVQFHTGVGLGEVVPVEMSSSAAVEDEAEVLRVRGTGIFNDPNDLALALVIAVPFMFGPLVRRATPLTGRIVAGLLLVPILVALYYTNSRGGVLGLGAALAPFLVRRFGRVSGPLAATVALVALATLGPSRTNAIDPSESSAQERVQSWSEGLQMLKSHPLFGVGYGRYTDFHSLVAHNSFVHTLGELGLFGSFFFVGMGDSFFRGARQRVGPGRSDSEAAQLRSWGEDLGQSGLGFVVCAMFLSQQYSVLLFAWVALSGCYVQIVRDSPSRSQSRPVLQVTRILGITAGAVVCTYAVVRIFANWSA